MNSRKAPIKMPKGRKAQISRAKREGVSVVCTDDKKDYEAWYGKTFQTLLMVILSKRQLKITQEMNKLKSKE